MTDETTSVWAGSQWLLERFRVTVFPCNFEDIGKELGWEDLTGEAPATVEQQPRHKIAISRGPYGNGDLVHSRFPDRIELIYEANLESLEKQATSFPNLGSPEAAFETFSPILNKWIESLPPIKRIAFGPILMMPVDSHAAAYERINNLLPFVTVDPNTTDFSYQINRPRDSNVIQGLKINRLSKWHALKLKAILRAGSEIPIPISSDTRFACRLEIDVNTSQELTGELPKHEINNILGELVLLSVEISQRGDIA